MEIGSTSTDLEPIEVSVNVAGQDLPSMVEEAPAPPEDDLIDWNFGDPLKTKKDKRKSKGR